MTKLSKPASEFLKPDDVNDGDTLKIIGHPDTIPAEESKFGKERHIIPVSLPDKTAKRWGLNLISYRTLYKAYGDEGDNWIGKQVTVVKNREKVRGETRYVLYAEPYVNPQQPLTTPASKPTNMQNSLNLEAFQKLPEDQKQKLLRKLSMQQ